MVTFTTYRVKLTGNMPLLLHGDDLEWRAAMSAWRANPDNKAKSVPGDDRSPAWTWIGGLYHDGRVVGVPSDNLMTALREGGSRVSVPGKRSLTYKRQSQSGLVVNEILWPLITKAGDVPYATIDALRDNEDFEAHKAAAVKLGFELFAKGARIGQSKHVRVRAKFVAWTAEGTITVFDDTITAGVLENILACAGRYCGIGDWRPSSPKSPGPYGTFTAALQEA
jgi:hypothetical protein